jgi:hypothetical protein
MVIVPDESVACTLLRRFSEPTVTVAEPKFVTPVPEHSNEKKFVVPVPVKLQIDALQVRVPVTLQAVVVVSA